MAMAEEVVGSNKKMLRIDNKNTKGIAAANAAVSSMSIISSYNICHSLCMSVIALLSVFGIIVAGMPLAFLTQYQIYFWLIGSVILAVAVGLYIWKGPCMSPKLLAANAGLLLAGFPFAGRFYAVFMLTGFAIVITTIIIYLKERAEHGKR